MKYHYRKSFRTKRKNNNTKYVLYSITIIVIFFVLLFAKGLPTWEQMECERWDEEAYPYFSNWQIEQCRHYNIELK